MFSLDLGNLLVHLKLESGQWTNVMRNVETRMNRAERRLNSFGRNMTMKVTVPLLAFGAAATKTFASFDDAMTRSTAIMGSMTAEMDEDLRSLAKSLSLQGVQSAKQLAESYFFLASAGLDVKQSMAALPVVQKFATAGAFEMALATDLVTDAQSALGLTVKDSQQNMINMVKITDILTGANTLANASTQQFSEALMRAGPAMKAYGIELEDGVATLAAYADQGKKGAEGGELFGRMLRLMIKGFNDNRAEWDRFNVSIVDAQDNLRPMADIVRDLTGVLGTMGVTQKAATLELLGFQARSQQAIMPLLGLGDAIEQYNIDLHQMAGITEEVANKQLESLGSQLRIIWNHIKAVAASFGSTLEPMILKVGESVKIFSIFWLNLNEETQRTVGIVAVLAASLGPVALAMALIVKAGSLLVGVFAALNVAALGWVGAVVLLAGIAYTLRAAWEQNLSTVKDRMEEWLLAFQTGLEWLWDSPIGDFLKYFVAGFTEAYNTIRGGWADTVVDMAAMTMGAGSFLRELKDAVSDAWAAPDISTMVTRFEQGLRKAKTEFGSAFEHTFDALKPAADDAALYVHKKFTSIPLVIEAFGAASVEHLGDLLGAVKAQFAQDFEGIVDIVKQAMPNLTFAIDEAMRSMGGMSLGPITQPIESDWKWAGVYPQMQSDFDDATKLTEMSEEAIRFAWDRMYDGLNDKSAEYFHFQRSQLKEEVELWKTNAAAIAQQFDTEETAILSLIDAYEKEQKVLMEIAELKQGDTWAGGLKAFALETERAFKTAGEKAYEFAQSMEQSVSNGLQSMSRDMDNWGEHAMQILEEVYFEAIRIAFIQPVASAAAGAFAGIGSSIFSGMSAGTATAGSSAHTYSGYEASYADGGIAWHPQIASLAENEPELITPFSELRKMQDNSEAGSFSLHIENNTNTPIEADDIDFDPDRMIANITIRDKRNRGPVSRASRSRG